MHKIQHFYTQTASIYDNTMESGFISRLIRRHFQAYLAMHFSSASHVLDVGCGTGTDALFLAAKGIKVHGVDISPGMIEMANQKTLAFGLSKVAQFSVQDANALDALQDQTYDGACSNFNAVNHLADPHIFAQTLSEKLLPGATVVLTLMNRVSLSEVFGYAVRFQFKSAFRKLFFREKTLAMTTHLFFPVSAKTIFEPYFSCTSTQGFGLFVPVAQHYQGRFFTGFFTIMAAIERPLLRFYPFYNLCDHYILILKKK